jgi:AraC-like DNA-binding protein
MRKRALPAVDGVIASQGGVSRDGQPLSYNRAPAPDLAPWVGRLYATVVDAPADHRLDCTLFNDATTVRLQIKGQWTAQTADGPVAHERAALIFGPHSRAMPVSVTGSFISVGLSLRPGSGHALHGRSTAEFVDRLVHCDDLGLPGMAMLEALETSNDAETWLAMLEEGMRRVIAQSQGGQPDHITARFEELAFTDPSASISDFAKACEISQKQLERIIRRDFGMPPKQVLRRARALDMASSLRGVADHEEAEELALRFYDQSHLIREFTSLFGMSPRQFVARPQPILTLTLESRQARRLELTRRLAPGAIRPWQQP